MTMDKSALTPFGREVKIRLIEKSISQRELARNVGTTESYLCQILYGIRAGEKYITKIAAILDIDLSKYAA